MEKTDNYSKINIKVECRDYYDKGMSIAVFDEPKGKFLGCYYTALETAESFLKKGHTLNTIVDYITYHYHVDIAKQTLAMLMQKHPLLVAQVFLNGEEEDVEILDSGGFAHKYGLDINLEAVEKYFE